MSSEKRVIETAAAPKALGPYSQAVAANGFIFCAGQKFRSIRRAATSSMATLPRKPIRC